MHIQIFLLLKKMCNVLFVSITARTTDKWAQHVFQERETISALTNVLKKEHSLKIISISTWFINPITKAKWSELLCTHFQTNNCQWNLPYDKCRLYLLLIMLAYYNGFLDFLVAVNCYRQNQNDKKMEANYTTLTCKNTCYQACLLSTNAGEIY